MLIVLDTNVLVSGLLTPHGPPGRLVDLIIAGEVTIAYDDRILAEYREVLGRPKFEFDPSRIRTLLGFLQLAGHHVSAPPLEVEDIPDVADLPFAEVALAAEARVLVTGNPAHFQFLEEFKPQVLTPRNFIDQWPNLADV